MIGKTNVGGGNNLKNAYAIISVEYPSGARLTCTNGSRTLKASNDFGEYVFGVPTYGTWTVIISRDGNEVSKPVEIGVDEQGTTKRVKISFNTYYFDRGVQNVPWSASNATYVKIGDDISVQNVSGLNRVWAYTTNKVNLTDIDYLYVSAKASKTGTYIPYIAISDKTTSLTKDGGGAVAYKHMTISEEETTVELDVSAFTGEYYIVLWGGSYDNGAGQAKFTAYEVYGK